MSETVILTSERENEAPPIGYDAPVEAGVTGLPMEQVLRHHARTIPDFPAITFEEETLSYRAFDRETNRIANELAAHGVGRSEEHTSELQSLMRTSYAVFCLKKTK